MWQWMRSTAWSSSCLRTQTKKRKTSGNSSENLKNTCNNFEVKWDPQAAKRRKVNLASLEAAVKTAADLQAAAAKAAEEAAGCRASNQSACDEEAQTSQQDPSCISFVFANITCWSAPAEKLILYQCHDYHVVPFAESRVARERNSSVVSFSAPQGREVFLCLCVTIQQVCERFAWLCAGSSPQLAATGRNGRKRWRSEKSNEEAVIGPLAWSRP